MKNVTVLKRFATMFFLVAMIFVGGFAIVGCQSNDNSQELVREGCFDLNNMYVVVDNTQIEGYYNFEAGSVQDNLTGSISCKDCQVIVKGEFATLTYTKEKEQDIVVVNYLFERKTNTNTFVYSSYEILLNGAVIEDLENETLNSCVSLKSVLGLNYALAGCDTTVQLIPNEDVFCAHIREVNKQTGELVFLSYLFGTYEN